VVLALLVGGVEKLGAGEVPDLGVPVRRLGPDGLESTLKATIEEAGSGVVLDLSDEPVLGYRERMRVAAVVLAMGAVYEGSDFRLTPPEEDPAPPGVATLAVFGTGKRTGKTAIGGEVARTAVAMGRTTVVVAMGRGGPADPQLVEAGSMSLEGLLELGRSGRHAASDYLEDAITSGVTTVGARRAGGGLAGAPYVSNVREAVAVACDRRPDLLVLEGSGAALPPMTWDAGVLVVPAHCPVEYLTGYLGPYRLLRADLAVVTMKGSPVPGSEDPSAVIAHLRRALGDARVVVTDFVPVPLADVDGRDVFLASTAPEAVVRRKAHHLQAEHGCTVVGWSDRLADRAGLAEDLDAAPGYDVLLTELKAAAIDVASERALLRGAEVVFVDNRAVVVEGPTDLSDALRRTIDLATARGSAR
jgi:cyclic 2,3-diphosphoglycerate synthetase